jgi:hypothetical protein
MPKTIQLFEENCCGPSSSTDFVSFLRRRFGAEAEVQVFDLAKQNGRIPLSSELLLKIQTEECLPLLVVDGVLVAQRKLPNFLQAVELVRTGQPSPTSLNPSLSAAEMSSRQRCQP